MKNKFLFLTPFLFHTIFSFSQSRENFIFATMETENAAFLQKNHVDSIEIISSKNIEVTYDQYLACWKKENETIL